MTDWNAVTAFMGQVVAWPVSPTDPGYVNLHYSMLNQKVPGGPLIKGLGWPMRDLTTFVNKAAWVATTNNLKDVWFCLSRQSQSGKNSRGNPKAVRGAMNATHVKAVWVDVDVGVSLPNKPPKYATVEEALAAILLFQKTVKLPTPSAIVFSGGGIHVYWISDVALTPAEWAPYASGLKNLLLANAIRCDAGLTTDIARILRVPGTLNHKYDPPKPVELSPLPLQIYNFEKQLSFLKEYAGPITARPSDSRQKNDLFVEGVTFANFGKPDPIFAGLTDQLGAGVALHADVLLKAQPIFKQCGFMGHALKTGGADYDNPLWNLSVLCSTFMENGNAIAHAISKEHATYSEADTQALYDRKVADRHDRGLGYPSCSTIQSNGCASCATCPLFSKGKSPLNIRPVVTATVNPIPSVQSAPAQGLLLPASFDLNDDGIICKIIEITDKEGELQPPIMIPLFYAEITEAWAQKNPDCINFTVTVDKGFTHKASVRQSEFSKMGFAAYLGSDENRVKVRYGGLKYLQEFFLAWIANLHAAMAASHAQPFGWYLVGTEIKGFVYGGNVMEDDGSVRPCGIGDPEIKRQFTPTGDIADWYAAAATVTNRKRSDLNCLLLAAFASPLVHLAGLKCIMISAKGTPGSGKSSAFQVGLGMWGHIGTTKGGSQSTRVGTINQLGETKNLPYYWDEIQTVDDQKKVADMQFELTEGTEKARGQANLRSQVRRTWKNMTAIASNDGMVDYLRNNNQRHAAGLLRIFEWDVPLRNDPSTPGWLPAGDADAIINKLEQSFGMMGAKYSQYLAVNHARMVVEVMDELHACQIAVNGREDERFWMGAVATLVCAARYAKDLGVDVDEDEVRTFLHDVYLQNRETRDRSGFQGSTANVVDIALGRYLKDRGAEERAIWTDDMPTGPGKPKVISVIHGPTQPRNFGGGIEVRWVVENKTLVIAKEDFVPWVHKSGFSRSQVEDGLLNEYKAQFVPRLSTAAGVWKCMREPCIVIPVKKGTDLWEMLFAWSPPEVKAAAEAAAESEPKAFEPIETGLEPADNVVAFVHGATRG